MPMAATGHSYSLRLHLSGQLDEVMGWVQDFGDVKTASSRFTNSWTIIRWTKWMG